MATASEPTGKIESALTVLRNGIINGRLPPEQPLTSKQVQDEFELSRSSALEVLRRLELDGYAKREPPHSFFVRYYSSEEIYSRFITLISLEAEAASMLAPQITSSQIKTMRSYLAQMKELGGRGSVDVEKLIGLLREFRIYQVSLLNARPMADAIATAAQPAFLRLAAAAQSADDLRRGRELLESLVDAYEANDPAWASSVVRASYYPLMYKLMERATKLKPKTISNRLQEVS